MKYDLDEVQQAYHEGFEPGLCYACNRTENITRPVDVRGFEAYFCFACFAKKNLVGVIRL